jgi:hypothetical protein
VLSSYRHSEKEMSMSKPQRIIGATAVLVALSLGAAIAQTQSPAPSPQSPLPSTPQATPPQATPSTTPIEKKAAVPAATGDLLGLAAKSSDGTNLGPVHAVIAEPGGKTSIGVKVGGFLGFGGHTVAIPDGKFNRIGDAVLVNMTAAEISKLPRAIEQK